VSFENGKIDSVKFGVLCERQTYLYLKTLPEFSGAEDC
jgi:hypothetical protein